MKKAIIDYYMGGYGPTIYIGVKTMEWLVKLRDAIIQLKDGFIEYIAFDQFEDIEILNINTFILVKTAIHTHPCIRLRRAKKKRVDIIWSQDDVGLEHTLMLIDGLIERDSPGHQPLDEDKVLIELSYKENL